MPDTDEVVSVASKQVLTISGPGERDNARSARLSILESKVGLELVNELTLLKVKDLDGRLSGSTEPVSVGREGQSVNLISARKRVEMSVSIEVPKDNLVVFTTGSAEGSIRGDGDRGDVALVANAVGLKRSGSEVPNLVSSKLHSNTNFL